ncbi:hypothetical protein PUN28_004198 [Cardiocondyla obscurior]|uniref:Spaetzle domain-containing protein n=1 Tax=Cardiocondyla obscurior TaxID=286306 RepID=A0AAW2GQ10_9HYME
MFVIVCLTVRVEGHPHAFSEEESSQASNSSDQDESLSISRLIDLAYRNHELLPPQQWSEQQTDRDSHERGIERTQWDTTEQQESSSETVTQYRKRKLLQVTSSTISMHRNSDEKIIFPDGRNPSFTSLPPRTALPVMLPFSALPCRSNSTFCENVINYPKQLVNAAIARNASLRFLETVDPMPIEQRIDVADEWTFCRFREQVVYPQSAQNKEKQWLFIVNQDELKQGIRIEVCVNEGQGCSMIDGFAEGYKTICKQKFIYRELAAVGSDGSIVKDQFRFPSSCCCHVKSINEPTVRLGLGLDFPPNRTQYNRPNVRFSMSTQH